jgi:hypothetical protein
MTILPLVYTLFTGKPKAEHPEDPPGPCKD